MRVGDEATRHVVDLRDVVGVHGVAQPEAKREQPSAKEGWVGARYHEQQHQSTGVDGEQRAHDAHSPPFERVLAEHLLCDTGGSG